MSRMLLILVLLAAVSCGRHEHHVVRQVHEERAAPIASPAPPTATPRASRSAVRPPVAPTSSVWDRLVACEAPGRGWTYGAPGTGIDPGYAYEGGPNFLPSTWRAYKDPGMPVHAYDATREQQIVVARRVLAAQGVRAWPVCGPRVGLTRENGNR